MDPKSMNILHQGSSLYMKKKSGMPMTSEEESKLKALITEGFKNGVDIVAEVEEKLNMAPEEVEPFPASAVARHQKKVEQALKKGQRAPSRPLFLLANVCTQESWMTPAVEAGVMPMLKRVVESERKFRKNHADTSQLQWCIFALSELCMHPSAVKLIDIGYFYEMLLCKKSSVYEKNMALKAVADRLVALGPTAYRPELMRVVQDAAVMEELSIQLESNEMMHFHMPDNVEDIHSKDAMIELPVVGTPMRLLQALWLSVPSDAVIRTLANPYKERHFRRFKELFAMKGGVGQIFAVRDPVQCILKEFGMISAAEFHMNDLSAHQNRVMFNNLKQDTKFRQCQHCKVEESPKKPHSVCSGCRKARYCGPTCAKADWKQHKLECKMPAATKGKKK